MTAPLDCPGNDGWQQLFDLPVSPDQLERLERHVESCPACQQRLDWTDEGEAVLRRLAQRVGDPTTIPADPTLEQVQERLTEGNPLTGPAAPAPAELYFLRPSDQLGILGTIGPYEIQEVIGHGGMGIVLKAFDPGLHRLVAIKVLAAAVAGSALARRRFTREAQAAAAVSHEHIVPVHGVHETDGLPYLVMQYIEGESLQTRLDRTGPLEVIDIVRIGQQTAAGLAVAHAQGLIHRDIKPANLLLENGLARVKITDFGLARMADDARLTQNGVVAGTPEYMAPEQARGEPIDHRADLFSLGSVLYALCTGVPPFRAPTPVGVLRQLADQTPPPVRSLNPQVPIWLEKLIASLLAKDPADRISSAAEVATLLEGYLAHLQQPLTVSEPELPAPRGCTGTQAKEVNPSMSPSSGSSSSWILRTLVPLLVLVGIGTLALVLVLFRRGNQAREREQEAVARNEQQIAKTQVARANQLIQAQEVAREGKGNNLPAAPTPRRPPAAIAFAPGEGARVVRVEEAGKAPGAVLIAPQVNNDVWSIALSRDGQYLAASCGWWENCPGETGVWNLATRQPLQRFTEDRGIASVAFTPDGKRLASGSWTGRARVYDWAAGKEVADFPVDGISRVAISPDGQLLATAAERQTVQLWNLARGQLEAELEGDLFRFHCVAFSPDGKRLLAGGGDWNAVGTAQVTIWDVASKKQVLALKGHERSIVCLTISPDGKTVVTGAIDNTIRFWNAGTGQELRTLRGHTHWVECVAFSPDGKTLVSSSHDKTIRFWDVAQGMEVGQIAMPGSVRAVLFTPDGKTLIAGGGPKTLKLFDATTRQELATLWNGAEPRPVELPRWVVKNEGGQPQILVGANPGLQPVPMDALPVASLQKAAGTRGWLAAALILGLLVALLALLGFGVRVYLNQRRTEELLAPADGPAEPVATAAVLFRCSDCGRMLKSRVELAGKKVKCGQCGTAVFVPEART